MGIEMWPNEPEKPHVGFNDLPEKTSEQYQIEELQKQAAAKDAEIADLNAKIERAVEMYADLALGCNDEIQRLNAALDATAKLPLLAYESDSEEVKALKAENERLTNGIADAEMLIMFSSQDSSATALIEAIHDCLKSLISPVDGLEDVLKDSPDDTYDSGKWGAEGNLDRPADAPRSVSKCNLCLEMIESCECEFTDDDAANRATELMPDNGAGKGTANVDENGLKPCPFCGSKADFLTFELGRFCGFEIRCSEQSCNAYKQTAPLNYWPMAQLDRQKAKWNRRQTTQNP